MGRIPNFVLFLETPQRAPPGVQPAAQHQPAPGAGAFEPGEGNLAQIVFHDEGVVPGDDRSDAGHAKKNPAGLTQEFGARRNEAQAPLPG